MTWPDESPFICPTSGILLGALVDAFQLGDPDVGGPAAARIGSDATKARNARRYFDGEETPHETRQEYCRIVARAAIHAGLLDGIAQFGGTAGRGDEALADMLFHWLCLWDHRYRRAAAGWPHPPRSLSGYLIGRHVVIDLALRAAALMHLAGFSNPEVVTLCAPAEQPGRSVLEVLMEESGRRLTREALANEVGVDITTVGGWIDHTAVPREENLRALARTFATPTCAERRLLRWLRIQYAAIRIVLGLRRAVGDLWARELLFAFGAFVDWLLTFHTVFPGSRAAFMTIQRDILLQGVDHPTSPAALAALRDRLPIYECLPPGWVDELTAAEHGAEEQRLEACFSVVGDWPLQLRNWNAGASMAGLSDDDRRLSHAASGLTFISPIQLGDLRRRIEREHPAGSEVVREAISGEAWMLMQMGRYDEAAPLWARVVASREASAVDHCYYGQCLWRWPAARRYDDAILHLREARRMQPEWDFPLAELGRLYLERGWPGHAASEFEGAPAEMLDTHSDCAFVYGLALSRVGRYKEALAACMRATTADKAHGEAWDLAAECAFRLGDRVAGRAHARRARHLGCWRSHTTWVAKLGG